MILNNLVFCIDENKKFVNGSIPSGKITANDINSNSLYVITPSPIKTLLKASFQNEMQNETPETTVFKYVGDKIKVDELVPKNAQYYELVKDWNVFVSNIPQKSLEMISYSRAGTIGVSFNFAEKINPQPPIGYNYIADITNPNYIPTEFGYYVVKVAVYEFDGIEFTYNDFLIKTSTSIIKRDALTIVRNTNTLRYSIDPSVYTQSFETPPQDIVDLMLISIGDLNQRIDELEFVESIVLNGNDLDITYRNGNITKVPVNEVTESGYYDETSNELVLVLVNGSEIRIPVDNLLSDLDAHNIRFNGSGTNYLTTKTEVEGAIKELDTRVKTELNKKVGYKEFYNFNFFNPDLEAAELINENTYRLYEKSGTTLDYELTNNRGEFVLNSTGNGGSLVFELDLDNDIYSITFNHISGTSDNAQYLRPSLRNNSNVYNVGSQPVYSNIQLEGDIDFLVGTNVYIDYRFTIMLNKGAETLPYVVAGKIPEYVVKTTNEEPTTQVELTKDFTIKKLSNGVYNYFKDNLFYKRVSSNIEILGSQIATYVELDNVAVVVFPTSIFENLKPQDENNLGSFGVVGWKETIVFGSDDITKIGMFYTRPTQVAFIVPKGSYTTTTNAKNNFPKQTVFYELESEEVLTVPDNLTANTENIIEMSKKVYNISGSVLEQSTENIRNLKPYYLDNIKNSSLDLTEKMDINTLSFSVITDSHLENSYLYQPIASSLEAISALVEYNNVDFIALLGDYIIGDLDKNASLSLIKDTIYYSNIHSKKEIYVVKGNHDTNTQPPNWETMSDEEKRSFIITNKEYYSFATNFNTKDGVVYDENNLYGSYFYRDFEKQKIRAIFLNTSEMIEVDGVVQLPEYGYAGVRTQKQLDWLKNSLIIEEGWAVSIFMHIPPINTPSMHNRGIATPILTDMLVAFKNGTSGSGYDSIANVSYDFTPQGEREIIGVFCGHIHEDIHEVENGINYFVNNSTVPIKRWETSVERELESEKTLSVNTIIINRSENKVSVIKTGVGEDYEFTW